MPRYFCDYCDVYLTHDSAPGRKQHIRGWKHRENVKQYYEKYMRQYYDQNTVMLGGPMMAGPKPGMFGQMPSSIMPPPPRPPPPRMFPPALGSVPRPPPPGSVPPPPPGSVPPPPPRPPMGLPLGGAPGGGFPMMMPPGFLPQNPQQTLPMAPPRQ